MTEAERKKGEIKLQEIRTALQAHDWKNDYSLFTGKCGYLVLLQEYMYYHGSTETEEEMNRVCENLFDDVQQQETPMASYCQGLAGLVYTLASLGQADAVDDEVLDTIAANALEAARKDNFDLLHGSAGMVYALSKANYAAPGFFEEWVNIVEKQIRMKGDSPRLPMYYPGHPFSQEEYQCNYSLSHGLTAVLLIMMELLAKKQVRATHETLLRKLIKGFMDLRNEQARARNESLYPSVIRMDESRQYFKRVAWCYGDFGVALLLNRYKQLTGDGSYADRQIEILEYYLGETDPQSTGVKDADFCHGAAGTALLYWFFYQETGHARYREAAMKWYNHTLAMDTFADGVAGYKHFDPGGYYNDYGMLEGVTGIGLVLLTFLSGKKTDWQQCFLIQ